MEVVEYVVLKWGLDKLRFRFSAYERMKGFSGYIFVKQLKIKSM
jgi:hypothetical protein